MNQAPDHISQDMLHAYVDGQLDASDIELVERHLAANPEIAAEIADWQAQNAALRDLFPSPDRLPEISALAANHPHVPWRSVAAAITMLGLGLAGGWYGHGLLANRPQNTEIVANLVREAIAAHVVYASDPVRPVEIPAAQEDLLVKWLSKRLGRALVVPDLSAQGFKLVGGRLLSAQEGPAAQFMYQNADGERITLFAVRADNGQMAEFEFDSNGKTNSFYWQDEKLRFALVGDLPRDDLNKLAVSVYRAFS